MHRIGRTGRAGSEGEAISLVSADEVKLLADIENLIRKTLVREQEPGFVPDHSVPITKLKEGGNKPKKPKKPKKAGQGKPGARAEGARPSRQGDKPKRRKPKADVARSDRPASGQARGKAAPKKKGASKGPKGSRPARPSANAGGGGQRGRKTRSGN